MDLGDLCQSEVPGKQKLGLGYVLMKEVFREYFRGSMAAAKTFPIVPLQAVQVYHYNHGAIMPVAG